MSAPLPTVAPLPKGALPSRRAKLDPPAWEDEPAPPRKRFGAATALLESVAIIGYAASRAALAEPIEEVWKDVFGPKALVELTGASYGGKTGLATGIVVARANPTGVPVKLLGRDVMPMPEGKLALVVNEENAKQSAVATIDKWIEILGLPPEATWDRICLMPRRGVRARPLERSEIRQPPTGDLWASLVHALHEGAYGIAVFDTRARIFAGFGNPNDEDAQAEVSNVLTSIIEGATCPVIVISHTKKGARGDDIEDVSGSAQRGGGADVVLMVTATRKAGRVLASKLTFLKVRDGGDEHPEPISFAISKSEGKWSMSVDGIEDDSSMLPHDRVHRALDEAGKDMTASEIRKATSMNNTTVKDALLVLRREQRVKERDSRRNGIACKVYSATKSWAEIMPGAAKADSKRRREQAARKDNPFQYLDLEGNPNDV